MIDDTPPPANTSPLTHCCFSALIGQARTLASRFMWSPVLSKPPTQRIAWARLFWLSTDHKPRLHVSGMPVVNSTSRDVHICQRLNMGFACNASDKRWQSLWESIAICFFCPERTFSPIHFSLDEWDFKQWWRTKNQDNSYLKFSRTVLSHWVLSLNCTVCSFWLHRGWLLEPFICA